MNPRHWRRQAVIIAALAVVAASGGISGAQAQAIFPPNCTGTLTAPTSSSGNDFSASLGYMGGSAAALSATISGVVGSVDTAFLSQQGNAFVSAPGNAAADQEGGGVWVRTLAGQVTTKSETSNAGTGGGGLAGYSLTSRCSDRVQQSYGGMQVGTDLSRLNINGWNVHIGATAGYLGSTAYDGGTGGTGMRTGVDVPFVGGYVTTTRGSFFADLMVRREFYNLNLDSPDIGILQQPVSAQGISVSASAGYNIALANNFFIEPSAGFIWSTTHVDTFSSTVPTSGTNSLGGSIITVPGTTTTNDVTSAIGRLTIRAGTTITTSNVVYQPFVSGSIFHDFAGAVVSNYAMCPSCVTAGGVVANYNLQSSTTSLGTYGQFSAGVAAQLTGTGWLGFVRADYKYGPNIQGYAGNLGLRYQFTPDATATSSTFAKAPRASSGGTTNWTGFYLGPVAGGAYGRSNIAFPGAAVPTATSPWTSGALLGLEAGYNYQINNWVLGVEGDFAYAKLLGANRCGDYDAGTYLPVGFDPAYQKCSDRMNWTGTLAGRFGYAFGRTLLYAKAGAAWADGRVGVDCIDSANTIVVGVHCFDTNGKLYPNSMGASHAANGTGMGTSAGFSRVGWLLGIGTEFDLGGNWSAKAEYDYIQFGSATKTASDGSTLLSLRPTLNEVKVGVNYRFGGDDSSGGIAPLHTKAVPALRIHDWSGFYLGGNLGWANAANNWQYQDTTGYFTSTGQAGYADQGSHSAAGAVAGGQVGWRAQSGRVVYGIEAQGNWASLRGSNPSLFTLVGELAWGNETNIDAVGVFTAQLGYTAHDALFYVKGGALLAHQRYSEYVDTTAFSAGVPLVATTTTTRWGAAIGGGVEYAFSRDWSAGIDYVHGFLGSKTYDIPSTLVPGAIYQTTRNSEGIDMVTLRLNYKFSPDTWSAGR